MTIPISLRCLAVALAAALWLAPVQAQTTDYLGLPGPIALAGDSYALAWSSRPAENHTKQEYLPPDEAPDSYSRMLLVETATGGIEVMDAVRAQTEMLTQRKAM
ncbi:MAG TPA: hypothetical protein VK090_03790, partial [Paracoccaceae bacterium]|nr:hypothetical protein [Paracoccaceae bacterium]